MQGGIDLPVLYLVVLVFIILVEVQKKYQLLIIRLLVHLLMVEHQMLIGMYHGHLQVTGMESLNLDPQEHLYLTKIKELSGN